MCKEVKEEIMKRIFDYTIKTNPVLEKEEMKKLFKAAKKGDRKAWEKIILSNLGIVMKCARDCKIQGSKDEDFIEDLISDGFEELVIKAMDFDEDKNVPFSFYIWQWIKQWVYRKNLPMGISLYREEKMLKKAVNGLQQKLNREPSDEEISRYSGMSKKKIDSIRRKVEVHTKVSLDSFDDEDKESCLYNYVSSKEPGPQEIFERNETLEAFWKALRSLSALEQEILIRRNNLGNLYERPLSLREVSEILGISREKVRYTEGIAKKRLADMMQEYKTAA